MFDIMQIKTKFMRSVISKLIEIAIKNKLGYKVKVQFDEIDIRIDNEIAHVHVNGGFDMKVDDLKKFTKFIEEEE